MQLALRTSTEQNEIQVFAPNPSLWSILNIFNIPCEFIYYINRQFDHFISVTLTLMYIVLSKQILSMHGQIGQILYPYLSVYSSITMADLYCRRKTIENLSMKFILWKKKTRQKRQPSFYTEVCPQVSKKNSFFYNVLSVRSKLFCETFFYIKSLILYIHKSIQ